MIFTADKASTVKTIIILIARTGVPWIIIDYNWKMLSKILSL